MKTLVVDWLPVSLNKLMRMHWRSRGEELVNAAHFIMAANFMNRVLLAEGKRRVALRFYFPDARRRDADNYQKLAWDALKWNHLIVDDSPKWLEVAGVTFHVDKTNPRTEIDIEEASDDLAS